LLQRVVEFLRRFPQFPEVVMAVARKMDVKFWRALFHFVGDPAPLFERCVEARQVHMAASYLRILQNISGVAASRRAALKLLELALEQEDIELAGDLARFLEPMSTPDVLDEHGRGARRRGVLHARAAARTLCAQPAAPSQSARLCCALRGSSDTRFDRGWRASGAVPPQWPTGRQHCNCCTRSLMFCFRITSQTSRPVPISAQWRRAQSRRRQCVTRQRHRRERKHSRRFALLAGRAGGGAML
jgi:hypothetical protein